MPQPMQNPKDISDPTTTLDMALKLTSKVFQLNNTTSTNNNQRSSSSPCYSQIAQSVMDQDGQMLMADDNVGNQFRENAVQNVGNLAGDCKLGLGFGNVVLYAATGYEGVNSQLGFMEIIMVLPILSGEDHYATNCTIKPRKQYAAYLQKQMQIAQKEEAGIQLTSEEFDFMAAAGACEETEKEKTDQLRVSSVETWLGKSLEQH
ncbi:hypothetical protein Tco_0584034 [Tanacetum coccineum]